MVRLVNVNSGMLTATAPVTVLSVVRDRDYDSSYQNPIPIEKA